MFDFPAIIWIRKKRNEWKKTRNQLLRGGDGAAELKAKLMIKKKKRKIQRKNE